MREEEHLPHSGHWFCFDDMSVEPWDIASLERDCFGGRACVPSSDIYSPPLQACTLQQQSKIHSDVLPGGSDSSYSWVACWDWGTYGG